MTKQNFILSIERVKGAIPYTADEVEQVLSDVWPQVSRAACFEVLDFPDPLLELKRYFCETPLTRDQQDRILDILSPIYSQRGIKQRKWLLCPKDGLELLDCECGLDEESRVKLGHIIHLRCPRDDCSTSYVVLDEHTYCENYRRIDI